MTKARRRARRKLTKTEFKRFFETMRAMKGREQAVREQDQQWEERGVWYDKQSPRNRP